MFTISIHLFRSPYIQKICLYAYSVVHMNFKNVKKLKNFSKIKWKVFILLRNVFVMHYTHTKCLTCIVQETFWGSLYICVCDQIKIEYVMKKIKNSIITYSLPSPSHTSSRCLRSSFFIHSLAFICHYSQCWCISRLRGRCYTIEINFRDRQIDQHNTDSKNMFTQIILIKFQWNSKIKTIKECYSVFSKCWWNVNIHMGKTNMDPWSKLLKKMIWGPVAWPSS